MPKIPRFVQTEDRSFVRDTTNMALLSTDRSALDRHRQQRAKQHTQQSRLHDLERDVQVLKTLVEQLLHARD